MNEDQDLYLKLFNAVSAISELGAECREQRNLIRQLTARLRAMQPPPDPPPAEEKAAGA